MCSTQAGKNTCFFRSKTPFLKKQLSLDQKGAVFGVKYSCFYLKNYLYIQSITTSILQKKAILVRVLLRWLIGFGR